MSFSKVVTVQKPRKRHVCLFCNKAIDGIHKHVTGVADDDLYDYRCHIECLQITQDYMAKVGHRHTEDIEGEYEEAMADLKLYGIGEQDEK